jgi:hypothetical protein
MSKGRRIALAIGAVIVAIQVVPVDRANPPVEGVVAAPPEVYAVLERACFDCHSNETQWPWYSYIAPVSWLVAGHVSHGREEMNFSEWNKLTPGKQAHKVSECWELVEKGEMPLSSYARLHSDATLTDADRAVIRDWARVSGERGDSDSDSDGDHDERH